MLAEILNFKYSLDDRLPPRQLLLFGLQWFVLTAPFVVIIGKTIGSIQYPQQPELQLFYLQKLFLATGIAALVQLLWGHRLPLVVGPAAVMLIGIVASNSASASSETIYFSIAAGGIIVSLLGGFGLLTKLASLFTARIIGVVLMLIAFTMLPTVLSLITSGPWFSAGQLLFAACLLAIMIAAQLMPAGLFKSTLIVWALLLGSLAYYIFVAPVWASPENSVSAAGWTNLTIPTAFDSAVFTSFLFCYLALIANDVGSIQSTAKLLSVADADSRTQKGLIVTGFNNTLAGLLGVIGPVNYSLSPGIILSSGCASRYALLPSAAGMIVLGLVPAIINVFAYIPHAVIGVLLFYTMCSQISGSLAMLADSLKNYSFDTGLIIGVPVMAGTLIAFLPPQAAMLIPGLLRPLLSNGFVVGVVIAIILEHLLIRPEGRKI